MKVRYTIMSCLFSLLFLIATVVLPAGLATAQTDYPQLLSPSNGSTGVPVKSASFSWSPFKETTKYKFVLAKDAAMTQVVKETEVTITAFEYEGTLEYSTNYFWQVLAIEPAPRWSTTFVFRTETRPDVAPVPVSPSKPPVSSPTGLSCSTATIDHKTTSLDASPFLLGTLLLGLAIASRRKGHK